MGDDTKAVPPRARNGAQARTIRRAGVVVLLAVLTVIGGAAVPVEATGSRAITASKPTAAVAIGDSFISGEGAGDYVPVPNRRGALKGFPGWSAPNTVPYFCHRSANASIEVAPLPGIDDRFNLACSGGRPHDVLFDSINRPDGRYVDAQIVQLADVARTHDIDLVLIGLGSNNSRFTFGEITGDCGGRFVADGYSAWWEFWTWGLTQKPCTADDMPSAADLRQAENETVDAVRQILATLAAVDADGQHRIVLQDYTNPLPPDFDNVFRTENGKTDTRDKYRPLVRERYEAGCPAHRASLGPAHEFSESLGDLVEGVATTLAVEFPSADIVHLDVQRAFDGARLCEQSNSPTGTLATPVRLQDKRRGEPTGVFLASMDGLDKIGIQRIQGVCEDWQHTCQESWHPNAAGHWVLGRCLGYAWAASASEVACVRNPSTGAIGAW